jgi:hypothetical protein
MDPATGAETLFADFFNNFGIELINQLSCGWTFVDPKRETLARPAPRRCFARASIK